MTTTFPISAPLNHSHLEKPKKEVLQLWDRVVKVYHKHSDLVSQLGLFSLNTAILAGKIFDEIPKIVSRASLTLLNYMGLIYLNMQIRDVLKCSRDVQFAWQAGDRLGVVITAAKTMMKGINAILMVGGFVASVVSLCGYPNTTALLYATMRPFGMGVLGNGRIPGI